MSVEENESMRRVEYHSCILLILRGCYRNANKNIRWRRQLSEQEIGWRIKTVFAQQTIVLRKTSPCYCVLHMLERVCLWCPLNLSNIQEEKEAATKVFLQELKSWSEFWYEKAQTMWN